MFWETWIEKVTEKMNTMYQVHLKTYLTCPLKIYELDIIIPFYR